MKKALMLGLAIAVAATTFGQAKKERKETTPPAPVVTDSTLFKVELDVKSWINQINGLEYVKYQLKKSDLPAREVSYITDSLIVPLQTIISTQVNKQLPKKKD